MEHHAKTGARYWMVLLAAACALAAWPSHAAAQASQTQAPEVRPIVPPAALDPVLKELATYDGGVESAALWKLGAYVQAHKDDAAGRAECETKLAAFLKTKATPPAKLAAARWLRVIASEQVVPVLEPLLLDAATSDAALYSLQRVPGASVDQALMRVLPKAKGPMKTAVIGALGQRRSADAVPALTTLLAQPEFARPAAVALGVIGNAAAAQALAAAYPRAQGDLRPAVAASMMECAESHVAAGNAAAALGLYEVLAADAGLPAHVRRAAAMGRIAASGPAAPKTLMAYLEGSDAAMQEAAIARIAGVVGPDGIAPVCAVLPRLSEALQVQLLAVLSGYPRERVLRTVADAARGTSAPVRIAAINALQTTGDASVVSFLVETAARTRGTEQAAARTALGALKGRAVDDAILAMMAKAPSETVQGELLLAVADRRIFPAKNAVADALASPSPRVRLQALRALRTLGTPSDVPAVLTLLLKTDDETERTEAEKTTAALSQKVSNADNRASAIRMRLAREADPAVRVKLIGLLPLIGDNSTLPALRTALGDANAGVVDAAVRALAAWPTSAARDDVLRLAKESRDETHQLLALRGLVRIVGLDRFRDPKAAVGDLRQAASLSKRAEEQRLVLGALVDFPCQDALDLASGFLDKAEVKTEAQAAMNRIKMRMSGLGRRGTY